MPPTSACLVPATTAAAALAGVGALPSTFVGGSSVAAAWFSSAWSAERTSPACTQNVEAIMFFPRRRLEAQKRSHCLRFAHTARLQLHYARHDGLPCRSYQVPTRGAWGPRHCLRERQQNGKYERKPNPGFQRPKPNGSTGAGACSICHGWWAVRGSAQPIGSHGNNPCPI